MKRVHIIGLGWLGLPLALRLKSLGHIVSGTTSKLERRESLINTGGLAYSDHLEKVHPTPDIVICTLPPPKDEATIALHKSIAALILQWNAICFYTSSISVYPDLDKIITEEEALLSSSIYELEQLYLRANPKTVILRLGGLFGFERHPAKYLSGRTNVEKPNAPINLVSGDQVVSVVEKLIEKNIHEGVYNVVDENHPTRKDYYSSICRNMLLPEPHFDLTDNRKGKIVSSDKLVNLIGPL